MPLCQIIWLTRSHMPANQHQPNYQKLAAGLVLVGWHMASYNDISQMIWQSGIFYYFYDIF